MSDPVPLRLLLLEDEPADAELTLAELRRAGFTVEATIAGTREAFEAALDPALDIILADYSLPQFDAERALRLVRERGIDVPVIVVAGMIGEERAAAIIRAGATDYLLKDRLGRLGLAIRQALRQQALSQQKAEAEARFRAIVEHAADIVVIVDARGVVTYASPAVERVLGYAPEAISGTALMDLVHEDDRLATRGTLGSAADHPAHPYSTEIRFCHQDGTWRWVEATATDLMRVPGGIDGVVINVRDVTERRRLEEVRAVAAERATKLAQERERARMLEELGAIRADFSAMVAHELGSRIAAILRQADLAVLDPLTPLQAETLAAIQREAMSLRALIADARSAATVDREDFAVTLHPVPVRSLLDEAAAFARTLPGEHPLAVEREADGRVRADPGRIGQVLRNLLDNAAKYSPPGASIGLRAACAGDRVRFEVADRGPGIDLADTNRIFDKFRRGRTEAVRYVPGAGLGLYLSRRITRAHGSELEIESRPGEGSTFRFELEVVR